MKVILVLLALAMMTTFASYVGTRCHYEQRCYKTRGPEKVVKKCSYRNVPQYKNGSICRKVSQRIFGRITIVNQCNRVFAGYAPVYQCARVTVPGDFVTRCVPHRVCQTCRNERVCKYRRGCTYKMVCRTQ